MLSQILKGERNITEDDKQVLKVVDRWVKRRLPEISTDRESEQSVSLASPNFPHLKIYGRIDLIEHLGNKNAKARLRQGLSLALASIRVTDFKTGSVRKKGDIEKLDEEGRMSGYLRQLAMYSYLLEQNPKWQAKVSESRLEFLEAKNSKETFYDRVITKEETDLLEKDITDYNQLVKSGEWTDRECHYNSYGKHTECEYCRRAEIYKIAI